MTLRSFIPIDAVALADVYRDAVRGIGPQAYTAEQIAAWASYPDDMVEFRDRMSRGLTLVAVEETRVIAFGQLEPDDHLAFLYCSAAHARRGVRIQDLFGTGSARVLQGACWRSARRPAG